MSQSLDHSTRARLQKEIEGEVYFDDFTRGRYSTDASIYQLTPLGVITPKSAQDVRTATAIAAEVGIPILPRGAGTSQNGQAIGEALMLDTTRHLNRVLEFDAEARTAWVEPGTVLDRLNSHLKAQGLFFPVDVSTANRATVGGMTGNNSCGSRSIRYGNMVHNVRAIDALMADGSEAHFQKLSEIQNAGGLGKHQQLVQKLLALGEREAQEIDSRFPKLLRRVGGYNIDVLTQQDPNLSHLLVGSEGTLGFFQRIQLDLQPLPANKVLGVCHFPSFYESMESVQHIVKLAPTAVELMDRSMIELARDIPLFAPIVKRFVRGEPEALLLVEFAGEDKAEQLRSLKDLVELMGSMGYADAVVEATTAEFQQAVWEVRKSGLNIMMSMKGDGKPVSFIEDCAVDLKDLAEYTRRVEDIFRKHGTTGTFYAHASVGCLHVRPTLNMKRAEGAKKMRAIVEETLEIVREYKGSHSGEHGDGISRSEFHEAMFGRRMVESFESVKQLFDPNTLFNPGKIVRPHRMDDRDLLRYKPGYQVQTLATTMDWSDWGGFDRAIEMCNNNGACRKSNAGVMCPSYRVTREEKHLTRGRANTLRLAISGQLGAEAMVSDAMQETMSLCVSCKGCKRECPTGVDMAKMKIEYLHQHRQRHGLSLRSRLVAYLPFYARRLRHFSFILNLRDQIPGLAKLSELLLGVSARRSLPTWRRDQFDARREIPANEVPTGHGRELVLLVDSFNSCFEPENARAALKVLRAAGYRVLNPLSDDSSSAGSRPLCCGRSFLSAGMVDEAKAEASRMIAALSPYVQRGVPIVGLEPSCLLSLRDEIPSMLKGEESEALAENAYLFEEFIAKEIEGGHFTLDLKPLRQRQALLHGHCHQKAFAAMSSVEKVLALIPDLRVETIDSSCCGMAGAFGYEAENYEVSMKMAELALLQAVRAADSNSLIVADGTSCRHQIQDGSGSQALHVARVLEMAL